ncbi:MAG TPA: vitamin K epoxide reductase family protein [Gelidibacter sp.]|uniref:vitamin K epoxide reductase family protein n=1 Tax=Gelidibacter sp. TaxID=2018083 RepID=UPI002CD697EE|nr:vitamin K epoxide reductase family protein [Gelidibacter sp.]HXJ97777.1 vitamin K epoxide reductase family protein [Gelidibacter sp.]
MNNLKNVFNYLDAEQIQLDKEEFEFQYNSHPDYPSLLALSDTLSFFNVNNAAFKIESTEIDLLPNNFLANLKKDNVNFLSFVEKKETTISYTNGSEKKYSLPKDQFVELWDDVILLAEKDTEIVKPKPKNWISLSLRVLTLVLFVTVLVIGQPNKWFGLFYVFPIIGLFLSISVLKDLIGTKSTLMDKFCNVTAATSCQTVVNSNKWKVFKIISFSDLSIVFFATQLLALFLMGISNNYESYFYLQVILLLISVPIIAISIYYQKAIEKKWCPICLTISALLIAELGYVLYLNSIFSFNITWSGFFIFLFVTSTTVALWLSIKETLTKVKKLKEQELKAHRFKRNYKLFKNMLLTSRHYDLPKSLFVFGNPDSKLNISIVTSPFCGHCTEPHYMLKSLLDKKSEHLNISILYNVRPENKRFLTFVNTLININSAEGIHGYFNAMDDWYQDKEKWSAKHQTNGTNKKINDLLFKNHNWFMAQDINFTPCLFINGFRYPSEYELSDLPFFIDELIEDHSLLNKKHEINLAEAEKL